MENACILICTTFASEDEARNIVNILLRERLVSCCQISNIESHYHWKGSIEHAQEFLVQMKTRRSLYTAVESCIREHHSYTIPEIVAYDILKGNSAYLDWIRQETRDEDTPSD